MNNKKHNKSLQRTNLSVTPFAEQKPCQHTFAAELNRSGIETVSCSIKEIDLQHLSESDLVVVGSWVDGLFLFGQKPAGVRRLMNLPVITGKKAAVYCTYALETGKTLDKLSGIVERRGGDVVGGMAIKRTKIDEDSIEFVDRLVGVLDAEGALS